MKFSLRALSLASSMAVLLAVAPLVQAQITGTVYENTPDPNNAGDLAANTASSLANATFTVGGGGINFQSGPSPYTVAGFLNNPTFSNQQNGFSGSTSVGTSTTGTEVVLTGQIFLTAGVNTFQVGHDDGVVLTILGTGTGLFGDALDAPNPTSFVTTPFSFTNTNAAGNYTFLLDYSECCGPPADLLFTVNTQTVGNTPEPSSIALLGTGLFAAAGLVRRRIFS